MTHTETTHESAQRLEQASRYLVSLARAMREATDEECRKQIADVICHALSDVARAGAVFRTTGNVAASKFNPCIGKPPRLRNQFLQVLTTQANRTVWPTTRAFFPSISVCLGERRGKKAIIDESVDRCHRAIAARSISSCCLSHGLRRERSPGNYFPFFNRRREMAMGSCRWETLHT